MADIRKPGHAEQSGFELQDIGPGSVIAFFITLLVIVFLANVVIRGIYVGLDYYAKSHQEAPAPMMTMPKGDMRVINPAEAQKFPEPRLETNERMEINDFRLKEEQTLHSYGWVDKDAGTMHIPIDRAMQLIAQRGLPVHAQPGDQTAAAAKTPQPQGAKE